MKISIHAVLMFILGMITLAYGGELGKYIGSGCIGMSIIMGLVDLAD